MAKKMYSIGKSIQQQARKVLVTGERFTRFDQLRQRHFWSMYYFAPDANGYVQPQTAPIFTVPPGQNGQGFPSGITLTERETNWKSQNRVPDNQNFEITEIGVSIGVVTSDVLSSGSVNPAARQVTARAANQFLNNTVLSITYLTNSVPLGLCADFGQASGTTPGAYTNGDDDVLFQHTNGFAAPGLRRRFKIPILLQHGETFAFAFNIFRAFYIGANSVSLGPIIARMDFWATESFVEKS